MLSNSSYHHLADCGVRSAKWNPRGWIEEENSIRLIRKKEIGFRLIERDFVFVSYFTLEWMMPVKLVLIRFEVLNCLRQPLIATKTRAPLTLHDASNLFVSTNSS